mgnify:CR=1 FL=1
MTVDRGVELCQALATRIRDWMGDDPPAQVVVIHEPIEDYESGQPTERTVYVILAGRGQPGTLDRGTDLAEFEIALVVSEAYREAGAVSDDWIEGLLDFASGIFDLLGDARAASVLGAMWPETAEVVEEIDVDMLRQAKRFWSALAFAYREEAVGDRVGANGVFPFDGSNYLGA